MHYTGLSGAENRCQNVGLKTAKNQESTGKQNKSNQPKYPNTEDKFFQAKHVQLVRGQLVTYTENTNTSFSDNRLCN